MHLYTRIILGALYSLKGQPSKVEEQLQAGVELAERLEEKWWEACSLTMLIFFRLETGNYKEALQETDKAREAGRKLGSISWQERALFLKGLVQAEMNALTEAEKTAQELKEMIQGWMNPKLIRDYYHLQGMIHLKKKNYSQAITLFERAKSHLQIGWDFGPFDSDQVLFAQPRAFAYFQNGNLEKAQEEYEYIQAIITGILYFGHFYVKSFYMLGRIYEQQGKKEEAIQQYEKFLQLWKEAEPGIPEIEDAKNKLASLKK
jgi:tetratricopeptide (TPR) repeat protein